MKLYVEPVVWQVIGIAGFMYVYNKPIDQVYAHHTVIPLYTSPPKREPLGDGITADMYRANKKATHPDSYWSGVYDAEKAHGIGGGE